MGLDVWFKDDIKNLLLGIEVASAHQASHFSGPETLAYREGFRAAIVAAAIGFGIRPTEVDLRSSFSIRTEPRLADGTFTEPNGRPR